MFSNISDDIKQEAQQIIDEFVNNIRKEVLLDLLAEFSRYKCYEHASEYLREYAEERGIKLEE